MSIWRQFSRLIGLGPLGEGKALPESEAYTDASEACRLASQAVAAENYPWREPVTANLIAHEGRARWFVRCNVGQRGSAMLVVIDDETRDIVRTQTQPR